MHGLSESKTITGPAERAAAFGRSAPLAAMTVHDLTTGGEDLSEAHGMRPVVSGTRHMVVAGHTLAAHAGFEILQAGGNAIDAGVAAGLALGVVESVLVNIAGVAPIILYLAERREIASASRRPKSWVCMASIGYLPDSISRIALL